MIYFIPLTLCLQHEQLLTLTALMSTTVDILCFISTCRTPDNELFKVKYAFNHETSIIYWNLNFTNNIHFQSLEVVYRGSETQLQVTENLNSSEV